MEKKNTTISDIALIAEVSKSTVSRVLTGNSFVEESKRNRIMRAIEKTSYVPNLAARSLRGRNTGTIGVILNLDPDYHFSDYISMETLRGISSSGSHSGYNVSIIVEECSRALPRILKDQSVDGLIVMGLKETEKALEVIENPDKLSIPVVLLNYSEKFKRFPSVSFSNEKNGYDFMKFIISMGHKNVGTIDCSPDLLAVKNRMQGVRRALDESGIDFIEEWQFSFEDIDQGEAGRKGAEKFLKLKVWPSVIIASADDIAISFIASLTAAGLKVPEDVSIVGVDDIPISKYIHPPLTTQKVEGYQRGILVFKMLKQLMEGDELEEKHIYIRSEILERESLTIIKG
jgi:LacI family transcriptional regulator, galactose operon repressor